ncbi:hypothetical protein B1222_07515 [Paenibacillus larvae subsp. pulvifaciens]|nr:hypothetical protein B1222_07515 [Paenibacillus larvae subsp. pulvifaciens]
MDIILKSIKYLVIYGVPILGGLHTFCYAKSPKYYFFIMRIFSKWRDTTWQVNAEYILEDIGDAYQKIESILKEKYKNDGYKRTVNMKDKKVYEFGIFNCLIYDDFQSGDFSSKKFFIRISKLNVTLNTADEKLRELREFFNSVERILKPKYTGYNLDIHFKNGKNPFFGLMVQRLGKENISHFECVFPISSIISKNSGSDRNQHDMRIYKEKICINESSFDIIEETAKRALLFK